MKHTLALASILTLLPALAEEAAKAPAAAPKTDMSFPVRPHFLTVKPAAFDKVRRASTNAVILDVRTPEEYAEGHIPGAVLLNFKAPNFAAELGKLDPAKNYLVHCAAGVRSAKACEQMHQLGFPHILNLGGGLQAWQAEGKPVEK